MNSISNFATKQRMTIIGDAFLMTSAAFSVVIGLSALLIAPLGTPSPGTEWAAVLSSFLAMGVPIVVPVLVWVLHGRRLSLMAVLGGALGFLSTGFVFVGFVALSALLGLVVSPFWDSEFAGPVLMLMAVAAACVAVVVWLVAEAIRDLVGARDHPWIDVLRMVCAAVLALYSAGVAIWITDHPQDDSLDALIFALIAGIAAALAVLGAEVLTALASRGKTPQIPPAPAHQV